jgi:biotin carboxylase
VDDGDKSEKRLVANAATGFLNEVLARFASRQDKEALGVKLLVPTIAGYAARSDVFERRFEGCSLVQRAQGFVKALQTVTPASGVEDIDQLLPHAVGAVVLREQSPELLEGCLAHLDLEFENRMSLPWIMPQPLQRKRLAFVQGRADPASSMRMWETASALGVSLVIFEAQGHWLQQEQWAHLYEAFVPMDISPDSQLHDRLAEAVRAYGKPIDGIMTVSDSRLPAVARAARLLGLTTNSSEAYVIAGDKFLTRKLEPSAAESFECSSVEQLRQHLSSGGNPPKYPLIVKPCTGWGSECVTRVENAADLEAAVAKAVGRHSGSVFTQTACVVEPYISGPEFDANFVLLDGKIIFSEISDDYPSRADSSEARHAGDFLETQIVFPSRLPEAEKALIRKEIGESILRQGFQGGVFHCEGRMRDSSVQFSKSSKTGFFELITREDRSAAQATPYLIENNARPPGYMESILVAMTYGVDYFAQQMLFALGPSEIARFLALAQPFKKGPQFNSMLQFVAPEVSGRLVSQDPGSDMLSRMPHLADPDNVPVAYSPKRKGDWINGPETSEITWLAWYCITSRGGLDDLLGIGADIQREYKYQLE